MPFDALDTCNRRRLAALLLTACVVHGAAAASEESCESLPEGLVLPAGESLRYGEALLRVATDVMPGMGRDADRNFLELDLIPNYVIQESGAARVGSYVPHLEIGYELVVRGQVIHQGALPLRMSNHGHTYGTSIALAEIAHAATETMTVRLTLDSRVPSSGCDPVPSALAAELAPLSPALAAGASSAGEDVEPDGTESFEASSEDKRFTVLSSYDPAPSTSTSDIWGYSDGTTHIAILGKQLGTSFIDVTDPANPQEVGFISGPSSSWRDMKVYQNYCYITTEGAGAGEGLQIVEMDVSDPQNPSFTLVNTLTQDFTTAHNIYIDTVAGTAWVVGASGGTHILDVAADPADPPQINNWDVRYVHDAYVVNDNAYFSEINNGLHEILDITNLNSLSQRSIWATPNNASHNSWANVDETILATSDETTGGHVGIYDIFNKDQTPPLLSEYDPTPTTSVHNIMYDDDDDARIAIAYYAAGGKLVDLHRPTAPVELASYDTNPNSDNGLNSNWGVYTYDPRGYIYLSVMNAGLYVLRYDATGGVMSGEVRDFGSGLPIPRAQVVSLADAANGTAGTDGIYAFYTAEGPVQLRASAWGYRTQIFEPGTMPLDGRLDYDIELVPLAEEGVSGTVRNAADSSPVEGATVAIVGSPLSTTTAPDGTYAFPDVAIGQQVLAVTRSGFSSAEATIVVEVGSPVVQDFDLAAAVFSDDAETDQGWTLGLPGDTATGGQWERVDPNGTGNGTVQPEDDHTADPADTAFITGQSPPGANTETNDVELGYTTLLSPEFDVSGLGAVSVRYHRWISTNSGFLGGGTLRVQVSNNGGVNWSNLEVTSSTQNSWTVREFDIGSVVPLTDQMVIRFRAEANTGFDNFRVLEVGIDDFELVQSCRARFNSVADDADSDGLVDGCDACPDDAADDSDGDGICGDLDNAPLVFNDDQTDTDLDGVGDAADNCVNDANVAQRDQDGDGIGDACDLDIDEDGLTNDVDDDDDGDGVPDVSDLCPNTADPSQRDHDLDMVGDLCDDDDGEVQGLRVDGSRLSWEPEVGSTGYHVYRGDLGADALVKLSSCRAGSLAATFFVDNDQPAPFAGFTYLVGREVAGTPDTLGYRSDDTERTVNEVCP